MSESITESGDKVCLRGGENWSQFEESILMYELKYKNAGKAIREGVRDKVHEPSTSDWVLLRSRFKENPVYILDSDLEETLDEVTEIQLVLDVPDLPDDPTAAQQAEYQQAMNANANKLLENARFEDVRRDVLGLYERMYELDENEVRLTSSARKLYNEDVRNAQSLMEKLRSDEGVIFSNLF